MDFLSNPEWQFIISVSIGAGIGILSIVVAILLARRSPQISLSYTATEIAFGDESENETKELLKKLGIIIDDKFLKYLCFVTFRIWNSGRESVTLPDDTKPLTIAFNHGTEILSCEKQETVPDDLELTYKTNAEKLLLTFPLLDPQESMAFKVLLTHYVNYSPALYVRVPGKKRIIRANNIGMSKEMRITAILAVFGAVCMYFSNSFFHNAVPKFFFIGGIVAFLANGTLFFLISFINKRMAPYPNALMLPSKVLHTYWKDFLRSLPIWGLIFVIAASIYFLFGFRALDVIFVIIMFLFVAFIGWLMLYGIINWWLKKRKKEYNDLLIALLTAFPFIAFFCICIISLIMALHS